MYDLAKTIQHDRRRQACLQRLAHSVHHRPRTLAFGPYRITVARDQRPLSRTN